jgi:hypothetical protein
MAWLTLLAAGLLEIAFAALSHCRPGWMMG